jgi:hypothetical protein
LFLLSSFPFFNFFCSSYSSFICLRFHFSFFLYFIFLPYFFFFGGTR